MFNCRSTFVYHSSKFTSTSNVVLHLRNNFTTVNNNITNVNRRFFIDSTRKIGITRNITTYCGGRTRSINEFFQQASSTTTQRRLASTWRGTTNWYKPKRSTLFNLNLITFRQNNHASESIGSRLRQHSFCSSSDSHNKVPSDTMDLCYLKSIGIEYYGSSQQIIISSMDLDIFLV